MNDVETNGKFAIGGFIKFFPEVTKDQIQVTIMCLKPKWERKFPGRWISPHIRTAGDDGSYLFAFIRESDGTWDGGFGGEIIEDLRRYLGRDEKGRPAGVHQWNIGGNIDMV